MLGTLTAAELELLLRETLDLATHRWTAWAESIAADKLARLRQTTPTGIALGGWGFVERVSRRPRTSVDPGLSFGAATGPLWQDTKAGGFVPRAVDGPGVDRCRPSRCAPRARRRRRSGLRRRSLERDLHGRSADILIAPLRAYAPRWKASGTFVEGDAEAIVSPSALVDGLALADDDPAKVAQAVMPSGAPAGLAAALASALATLRDNRHALADLLTAEAVHQTLLGNTSRAGAALDAAGRGGPPPADFDVLRTPRSGASLTSRIAVLLARAGAGPLPGGWPTTPEAPPISIAPPGSPRSCRRSRVSGCASRTPPAGRAPFRSRRRRRSGRSTSCSTVRMRYLRGSCSSWRRAPHWSPAAIPRGRPIRSGLTSC